MAAVEGGLEGRWHGNGDQPASVTAGMRVDEEGPGLRLQRCPPELHARASWFPRRRGSEEPACQEKADAASTPGWGRSPGEGHGNPLQYSCLENPMDRAAWVPRKSQIMQVDETPSAQLSTAVSSPAATTPPKEGSPVHGLSRVTVSQPALEATRGFH